MSKTSICSLIVLLFCFACSSPDQNKLATDGSGLWKKEFFNSRWQEQSVGPEEWFYRMTVIDAPANTKAMSIGEGHWLHPEVIRWEITRDLLIGWRTQSSIVGAEHELNEGAQKQFRGAPVVAFVIQNHFDIAQENEREPETKPWYERSHMGVDFSRNVISRIQREDQSEGIDHAGMFNGTTHLIDDHDVANPKRFRFSNGNLEMVMRHPLSVSNAAAFGEYGAAFVQDTAAPIVDIRHTFQKKEKSDFISLPYPESVVLVDEMQKPILDAQGNEQKIDIAKRFGFFRTNQFGKLRFDEKRGLLEKNKIANATLFHIWQNSRKADGTPIPMEEREVKPIVYYTNVQHPDSLLQASKNVADQWDLALRETVHYAQPGRYASANEVPRMFILKLNDCSVANVKNFSHSLSEETWQNVLSDSGVNLSAIENQILAANASDNDSSFSKQHNLESKAKADLERVCSALEFYTERDEIPFRYQRPGTFSNLMNLITENAATNWSGFGPMLSDPETGETIVAQANVNLKFIDQMAYQANRQVDAVKGESSPHETIFGEAARLGLAKQQIFSEYQLSQFMMPKKVNLKFKNSHSEMDVIERGKASPSFETGFNFMHKFASEHFLWQDKTSETILKLMDEAGSLEKGPNPSFVSPSMRHDLELFSEMLHKTNAQKNLHAPMMDPPEFVDNISAGIALRLSNIPSKQRYYAIRELIYEATMLHEIGHNLGLEHNGSASSDAFNYGPKFWAAYRLPEKLSDARAQVTDNETLQLLQTCTDQEKDFEHAAKELNFEFQLTTQMCLLQHGSMYSSIMDYHASALADVQGLSQYDKAALKWGYGQMMEVLPEKNLRLNVDQMPIKRWLFLNSWKQIPHKLLNGFDAIHEREHVKYQWNESSTTQAPPKNEVPYAFCNDLGGNAGPRCFAFDYGPDMQTSAKWLKTVYWKHYLFTHFAADRTWQTSKNRVASLTRDMDIMSRFSHIMRWYTYFKRTDKEFSGSDAEQDYWQAILLGINHFAHVIGHPSAGPHISAPTWILEQEFPLSPSAPRLAPQNALISMDGLKNCDAKSLTSKDADGNMIGRLNYRFAEVPLGIGRPLHSRASNGYEDQIMLYAGTSIAKRFALFALTAPMGMPNKAMNFEHPEVQSASWYQLFPQAVTQLYRNVITKNYAPLGPTIDGKGNIRERDIVDLRTSKALPQNVGLSITPEMDDNLPLFASVFALTFAPDNLNEQLDLRKSIQIGCKGCIDEAGFVPGSSDYDFERYVHLTGHEYYASKRIKEISIGAELLRQLNIQKERLVRIENCLSSKDARINDDFCKCPQSRYRRSYNEWGCCEEGNEYCSEPILEEVNTGACSMKDLENRRTQTLETINNMVGFVDMLRKVLREVRSVI